MSLSWMWGGDKNKNIPENVEVPPPSGGNAGGSGKGSGGPMDAYRFDSSALERAAKAAKELEQSSK